MGPVVYFLVLFSIVVYGMSIPALELIYRWQKVPPIVELEPVTIRRPSVSDPLPNDVHIDPRLGSLVRHNRFSRATSRDTVEGGKWDDLERCYSAGERRGRRSRSRPAPVTLTWRLTGATEGSEKTLNENKENERGQRRQEREDRGTEREEYKTQLRIQIREMRLEYETQLRI